MKQKDLALIAIVVIISAVISYLLSNAFISSPKNRKTQVEVVDPIKAEFNSETNDTYFNAQSVNPTRLIQIKDAKNPTPFNGE
jgi:capsular polysaccharide biosynthesis protein